MSKNDKKEDITILNEQEEAFCQLYVFGGSEYAGQLVKCYVEVYGNEGKKNLNVESRRFLSQLPISARVKELATELQNENENIAIKLQVGETLKAVMRETATTSYSDSEGTDLSPAPLRAVSVNAAKALMELYPIKHVHENKLKIEGDGNVIFNVIVPEVNEKKD